MKEVNIFQLYAILATLSVISVYGQISTPCTASMISSFTPCLNFITGSSANGSAPTSGCCSALKSLMSTSMDCACLLTTANVPIQLPINRTLAISLPSSCNMGGVPLQCKASGSPLPAPGPVLFGPTPPPQADAPFSPQASKAVALAPAPESATSEQFSPASPPVETEAPKTTPGIRPVLTSSASHISRPSTLLMFIAIMIFNCY
ncbi:LTP_2 domain-containing protein [Cephalotus follicularis]|uniref:LTP_2 domain-containing protein n=1 Tax=Cephalotus follicularis TaxID=3775 RepID=A0A1Q3CCI1_CEPFO|nr:LTP_2 domain-containing protein [Cephalotus follicularis]